MVNKALILAFTAMATAAPQFGFLSDLKNLRPGSKAVISDKAAPSGESIPDGLNYNKPLQDEDDEKDWSNWEYNEDDYTEDPKDPETVGSTVENKAEPKPDTTTVVRQITSAPYEEFPSTTAHKNVSTTSTIFRDVTTSTTLPAFKSTTIPVANISSTTLRQSQSSAPAYKQSTTSTTLRQVQSTTAPAYSTPVKQDNEIESYETPVENADVVHSTTSTTLKPNVQTPYQSSTTLKNEVAEPYHSTSALKNEVAEPYHSTTVQAAVQEPSHSTTVKAAVQEPYPTTSALKNKVAQPYQSTTVQAAVQEPYQSTTVQAAVQEPYRSTTIQAAVQEPYHTTTALKNEIAQPYQSTTVQAAVQEPSHSTTIQAAVQEPYHSTTLKNEVAQPSITSVQANVQSAYRRDLEGYGKAEFEKQSLVPTTSAAPACAIKSSAIAQPAVVSSPPLFGQAAESQVPSLSIAADKQSSSSIWSAVPHSTPAAVQDAAKQQQTPALSTSLPVLPASTPLADAAVPADARILVNNLRPVNTTSQSVAKNIACPAKSTVKLEQVTPTPASSIATAPASKLLQTFYPTTTGAANATAGIAAATTGAVSNNNTLPQFEGAAAGSPSRFIAGSVIALAIAAFAL